MKETWRIIKEADLTDRVSTMSFEDKIVFNDNPTKIDVDEAEKNDWLIVCRLQGTVEERTRKVKKIKEDISICSRVILDNRFMDENYFSQKDYQELILIQVENMNLN